MSPITAITTVLRKYKTFDGRATRAEYWWWALVYVLSFSVGFLPLWAFAAIMDASNQTMSDGPLLLVMIAIVSFAPLALALPTIAVTYRRLHDANMSGHLFWIHFVPQVGSIILLVLTIMPGTRGPNRFGPDPRTAR